ncbi:MAG: Na+/H+ antiporter NhaC family protein [Myxococcota bacterium]|nr:sodium:proton antiporter [Spirochaeta sp.]RPG04101.1 MAG: sodium:proton antiporter [Proteobacteria bacterium TMED72]
MLPAVEAASWISLVPALTVLVIALVTQRTFEALLGGTLVGHVLIGGTDFFNTFADSMLRVMQNETVGWITLVVGLFGSFIALLVRSGGTRAFGEAVSSRVKSSSGALLATWFMGLVIFLDDYLNALAVGGAMQRVTDRYRVSREKLAYVVDSTAAPICVLAPLSTWAFFVAGLLEGVEAAPVGEGMRVYVSTIPYILYAWVAVLLVPLVAMRLIPDLGPMRSAEARAASGILAPPDSSSLQETFPPEEIPDSPRVVNFILPLCVLIAATWILEDALRGVMIGVVFTCVMLSTQRVLNLREMSEAFFKGFQTMVYPLAIVVMAFGLRFVNEELKLTEFVIGTLRPFMVSAFLPAVVFLALSVITFSTGSFWGVYAVSLPIVVPLAASMDVPMPLALGAVISAGAFGSHACFYGDASVLAASSSGCNLLAHVKTQIPYAVLSAAISTLGFLALGFLA